MGTKLFIAVDINSSEFQRKLEEGTGIFIPKELGDTIEDIIRDSIRLAAEYPPETSGNQPPPPYYQRGAGMIGRGGGLTRGKESENLGRQWDFDISVSENNVDAVVVNRASYSARVQDEVLQTPFHARNDWSTMQDILRSQIGEATRGQGFNITVTREKIDNLLQRIADFFKR